MAENIIGVYKITNTITGDFYIGSSKNIKSRWINHKCKSTWKRFPNNQMYLDMKKYGTDKFDFQILEEVEVTHLKEAEQQFIELLKPTYNSNRANGWDFERYKEYKKEYQKSDKYKEYKKEYQKSDKYKEYKKEYQKSDKYKDYQKEYLKEYQKSDKYKDYQKEYHKSDKCKERQNKYDNQLCYYNGEILKLAALSTRFRRAGIEHPTIEAKKYIIKN